MTDEPFNYTDARGWIDGQPIDGHFTIEMVRDVRSDYFADAEFALPHEVTLESTLRCDDLKAYESFAAREARQIRPTLEIETLRPYSGPRPRFALWGARHDDVQIGSDDDGRWQLRLLGTTIKLTVPDVRWNSLDEETG